MPTAKTVVLDIGGVFMQLGGMNTLLEWTGLGPSQLKSAWLASPAVIAFETGKVGFDAFAVEVIAEFDMPVSPAELRAEMMTWMSEPYPGARDLLAEVRAVTNVAFLCNLNEIMWPVVAAALELEPARDKVFLSFEIGFAKPDARAFEYVCETLGVEATAIAFFDDSADNIEGARRAAWQAWQVDGTSGLRARLSELSLL